MRVAVVAPRTPHHHDRPGGDRIDWVARSLVGRGHDVVVFCTRWWDAEDVDEFEKSGVAYRAVAPPESRTYGVGLSLAVRGFSPDVIHVDGDTPEAVLGARYAAKLSRTPLLAEFYGSDPTVGKGPKAVQSAHRLVAPSRMVRTRLREAGADEDDVVVIPDPIDVETLRSVDPDPDYEDEIVYARSLDEGANLESLLLALAELRQFDWSATVVGDGPEREAYERQTRDLRIDDRVTFVGELDRRERIGVYRAARAFVQTARECPFATELLWALACGCVGIVEYHADSSAHELVEGRDRGFRTTSETELVDAIRKAGDCERRDFDERFQEFDGDPVLERYLACYRELVGDGTPS